jgi:hypothetical protein
MNIRKFYTTTLEQKRKWAQTYIEKHGKEHKNKYDREYYQKNKSLILALKHEEYKQKRNEKLAYQKQYDDKNRETLRSKQYERKNPFK